MAYKSYKGIYKPKNPKKYKGDANNIVFRSLWERKLMVDLDMNPNVLEWSSEETVIPYVSPKDGRIHRYFPDFLVTVIDMSNRTRKILMEIKPLKETEPPKERSRKTRQYLTEQITWHVNQAKWSAARRVCELNGWEFKIVTEQHLFPSKKSNKYNKKDS